MKKEVEYVSFSGYDVKGVIDTRVEYGDDVETAGIYLTFEKCKVLVNLLEDHPELKPIQDDILKYMVAHKESTIRRYKTFSGMSGQKDHCKDMVENKNPKLKVWLNL